MDLIDQCQKSLYEKCKYKVKIWEHKFKKINGRLPSKLDIKEAELEVRNAYKTYFQLKTDALEQSFRDVDGFISDEEINTTGLGVNNLKSSSDIEFKGNIKDTTWGLHLNKTLSKEEKVCEPLKPAVNLNLKITKKLSVGSKLIKRNPRKALSQIKNECNFTPSVYENSTFSSSEKNEQHKSVAVSQSIDEEVSLNLCSNFKTIKDVPLAHCTYSPSIIEHNQTKNETRLSFQNIDLDWLARVESSTNIINKGGNQPITEINVPSDEDIIDNSDEDSCNAPLVKKVKHNDGSVSFSKIGDHQQIHTMPVLSKVNHNDKVIENEIDHSIIQAFQGNKEGYNVLTPSIEKPDYFQQTDQTQPTTSETFSEGVKISIPQFSESSKKQKSKNLNENFVRINLKKKIYARGRKSQKFANYKKKFWRNKQNRLEESEEGVVIKGKVIPDKLLPLDAVDENESMLVTLNQAAGVDDSQEVAPPKLVDSHEDSDEEMTLSELKKLIEKENKKTRVKGSGEKQKETKIKINKRPTPVKTKQSKKVVENEVNKSISNKSKKPKIVKNKTSQHKNSLKVHTEKIENKLKTSLEKQVDWSDDLDLLHETLRLEKALNTEKVCPLYSLKEGDVVIDTPQEVYDALRLFGHESFREGQKKAVMRILSGKSTLVTLSTGSGKSLCYQLPAYLFSKKYKCISLVISPLISLMEDQIKCIPGILNAVCIHGNQTKSQRDMVLKAVASGEVNILMLSPESIVSYNSRSGFGSLVSQLPPIAFACLDEAHCLSQWSHNFRPSYLVVCKILQETLGVDIILGLTATATKTTRNSLISQLKIKDGEDGVIKDTPVPPNLSLSISKDSNKDEALLKLLLSKPFVDFKSIIIYCLRRDQCEKVAAFIRTTLKDQCLEISAKKTKNMSFQAEPYHAGLTASRRKAIQKAFISGKLRIIVATIAFGMGINKSDIRCVIHYSMPSKFESYVQEIGRAGRDDQLAKCHVFLDTQNADVFEHCRHIYGNSVDRHILRKLLRKVFPSCKCDGTCTKHEVMFSMDSTVQELDVSKEILATILCYLELHENQYIKILKPSYGKCKILSYGGKNLIDKTALSCKPLEIALKVLENDEENSNSIKFPIIPVAQEMKCDAGMCKQILKNLEWITVSGEIKRSSLTVEFFDLSFHLLSPGNLPDKDSDEVLDFLYDKVLEQENTAYSQLINFNRTLRKYSSATFDNSLSDNEQKSEMLKQDIRDYFESDKPLELVCIPEISEEDKSTLISDIRSLVSRYRDNNFTGRSVAKIFHGISSPNIPAYVWGRTGFWRKYLKIHFNIISKIATQEIIKMHL
ncbi:hypothetical protein WA026_020188 [Henosepilachna vigintioctopunctata]|uniref:DNA 3'-5' helicase n=1 Tax=Henosepilachna vigintioctopunctata TaxID=420089 RepID=A0AAW1U5W2_9CUCU